MREVAIIFDPERKLFLYFGIAFIAIGVGPFGTYQVMTLWERIIFWSLDIFGALIIILPILHIFYYSRFVDFIPPIIRFVIGVALGSIPAAAYISQLYQAIGSTIELPHSYPILYLEVTIFSSALLLFEFAIWPLIASSVTPTSLPVERKIPTESEHFAPIETPEIFLRLPQKLRLAQIISISMEDHYAHVITDAGDHMVLIRLSDAIALLGNIAGAQIHRSHWVSAAHVVQLRKNGRRHDIILSDGRPLPVSAKYLGAAKNLIDQIGRP